MSKRGHVLPGSVEVWAVGGGRGGGAAGAHGSSSSSLVPPGDAQSGRGSPQCGQQTPWSHAHGTMHMEPCTWSHAHGTMHMGDAAAALTTSW